MVCCNRLIWNALIACGPAQNRKRHKLKISYYPENTRVSLVVCVPQFGIHDSNVLAIRNLESSTIVVSNFGTEKTGFLFCFEVEARRLYRLLYFTDTFRCR